MTKREPDPEFDEILASGRTKRARHTVETVNGDGITVIDLSGLD